MIAYHVTRNKKDYDAILEDGFIKPSRLPNIYLFRSLQNAEAYLKEMCGYFIFKVDIKSKQIQNQWKPSYARNGVIKLKINEKAKIQLS